MNPYQRRNEVLKEMGFASYESYLRGDLWKRIKGDVIKAAERSCLRCGRDASTVHHSVYSKANLSGETTDGMHAICQGCHLYIEFDGDRKVSLDEANVRLGLVRSGKRKKSSGSKPWIGLGFKAARLSSKKRRGKRKSRTKILAKRAARAEAKANFPGGRIPAGLDDLTGLRFSELLVRERYKTGSKSWKCICDCGLEVVARRLRLDNGEAVSCAGRGPCQRVKARPN